MPRKKSTSQASSPAPVSNITYFSPADAEWVGFINIRLSDNQKLEFAAWWEKNDHLVGDAIEELLALGMKVAVSFDFQHDVFIVSVTGNLLIENPPSRASSTSRASSLREAYALVVFKHYVVAKGNYGNFRPKDSSFLSWG